MSSEMEKIMEEFHKAIARTVYSKTGRDEPVRKDEERPIKGIQTRRKSFRSKAG